MDSPTKPQTKMETVLAASVPAEERRATLDDLRQDHRPDADTIPAVVPLLHDTDEALRGMAEQLLPTWGQPAVTALLNALRSTETLDIPYRLAIIRQLARMGPQAARAETLLRSLKTDPDVGDEALKAVNIIRGDFQD